MLFSLYKIYKCQKGFSVNEVLLVTALTSILATFITINLLRPQTKASLDVTAQTLATDLKAQQFKSMSSDQGSAGAYQNYGIFFASGSYTIFEGAAYSAGSSTNFTVTLSNNLSIATTFPSSQIVFTRISGDVAAFTDGSNTITITDTPTGTQKVLTINRYGTTQIQ